MAIPTTIRPRDKRYLGNKNTKELHDLGNEKSMCQIDVLIRHGHGVVFEPDTARQAIGEGYQNCAHCIGGSTR